MGRRNPSELRWSGMSVHGTTRTFSTWAGIGVAIVDTGLDYEHSDLDVVLGDPCFDAFDGNCQDDNGHGTHVGGTVAALHNTQDVVGVAPGAALYAVKVLDSTGSGSDMDVINGLNWVLDNAAYIQVVNMSLGRGGNCGAAGWETGDTEGEPDNTIMREVLQDLTAAGITVVVSAGNDRNKEVKDFVPAGCAEVIAVASTTAVEGENKCKRSSGQIILADTASFFTTDGAFSDNYTSGKAIGVTISAPGEKQEDLSCAMVKSEGILSLQLGGGTTRKSGTSMAAPHIAGVVALMLQADSTLTPPTLLSTEDVRDALRANGDLGVSSDPDYPYLPLDPILGTPDGEHEGIVSAP